ncbi:endonuclease domain-containing protein [Microbacterium halophytorum]|uniref:endonuclease domain-containing protein n=1 Tax=Microbacterium halophytorum TaxID=2067568 RepID=UPI000CFC67F3|nr:DUF559 domain-containing protein [Microbacterium halophytorum]
MSLDALLKANGGWLHRSELLEHGWSPKQILSARRAEDVPLLRRRWLVLPRAEPMIVTAARSGAVITCVSALEHHGLWRPPGDQHDQPHFAVPQTWSDRPLSGRVHRSSPLTARDTRSLFDSVPNILANVALCLAAEHAFAVWESAIAAEAVTVEQLRATPWVHPIARELAAEVGAWSDSGVESTFVWRCRRMGLQVTQQVKIAGHRVDALIGRRIAVQLDGWAFHRDAAQRRSDIRHDRELVALGYVPLRFDYYDVMHDWPRVEAELRRVVARLAA